MSPDRLLSCMYFGDSLLTALLIAQLWRLDLHKRLRWFVSFLALDLLVGYSGLISGFHSRAYCVVYSVSEPLYLIVSLFVTREIFSGLYKAYPGLRILASRTLYGSVVIGLLSAGLGIPLTRSRWDCPGFQCSFFLFVEIKRFVLIGLVVFTLVMLIRLSRLPITVSRNTWAHGIIYNVNLSITVIIAIVFLLKHDRPTMWWLNVGSQGVSILCHWAWLVFLRRDPAQVEREENVANDESIKQLVMELRRFNEVLQLICARSDGTEPRSKGFATVAKEVLSRSLLRQ